MRPFARQKWPGTPDSRAIKGRPIFVFTIAVAVVAIPAGSLRKFDGEQGVDRPQRIDDPRIVGGAQSEPHQRQSVWADDVISTLSILSRRSVFDRNESLRRRRRAVGIRPRNAHGISGDPKLLRQVAAGRV